MRAGEWNGSRRRADPIKQIGGAEAMGDVMRELRLGRGMSQRALADRIGMHRNYYGAIERGGSPNIGLVTVEQIARGLEVSPALLAVVFARRPGDPLGIPSELEPLLVAIGVVPSNGRRDASGARAVGTAIQALRDRLGISQQELAAASDLHRGHLGVIEAGARPSPGLRTLTKVAHGLGMRAGASSVLTARLTQIFCGELDVAPRPESPPSLPDRQAPLISP